MEIKGDRDLYRLYCLAKRKKDPGKVLPIDQPYPFAPLSLRNTIK